MATKNETNRRAAAAASKVLRDSNLSKSAKTAAGSALTQSYRITYNKSFSDSVDQAVREQVGGKWRIVSTDAATAASRVLRSPGTSKSAKTLAGSALSQKQKK